MNFPFLASSRVPHLSRQVLLLIIPVAVTLAVFPALTIRAWRLLSNGGVPAAMLLVVTICAVVGIALRMAPAPGEPDVHDRQLDVILAVPLIGVCVWLTMGWPEHSGINQPLSGHVIIAATALVAGGVLLLLGTRLALRLRFILMLPLIAMPQITGRPAVLTLLLVVTIVGTLLQMRSRLRRSARPEASSTGGNENGSSQTPLLPLDTRGPRVWAIDGGPSSEGNALARDTAQRAGGGASPVRTVSAQFFDAGRAS